MSDPLPPTTQTVPDEVAILLRPTESSAPAAVLRAEAFIKRIGIWFTFSRNHEARSCRDAAHKRYRLGHEGIPLWDEMKSFFGHYIHGSGERRLFLAHCRGDRQLSATKLSEVLGAQNVIDLTKARLSSEEMEALGLEYGMVNPWQTWNASPTTPSGDAIVSLVMNGVEQVFDHDLLQPIGTPGTVMTNAGELTWAVEFHPHALVSSLDIARVASIAEPDPDEAPRLWGVKDDRPIGIITGNPPEAGMALWKLINDKVRAELGDRCCGDVSMPRMEVVSVPEMGLSMELEARRAPVEAALEKATRELAGRGVKLLALPCNTTSFFAPQIKQWCRGTPTRFLSMAEATGAWLRREGVTNVALVGINYVAELGHWSAYREALTGMTIERLNVDALERVRSLAYDVKSQGPKAKLLNQLRDILRRYVESRHIVLALTELSLLLVFHKGTSEKILIDPMNVYAEALTREYLGLPS